ncbi:MAG TPA: hypothetical protein VN239_08000 [Nitrososphaera sp.]|nr:hypothetical protein [Nitrososphaera sp.]
MNMEFPAIRNKRSSHRQKQEAMVTTEKKSDSGMVSFCPPKHLL